MSESIEALLRAVLSVAGRQAFPPDRLIEIVLFKGARQKQLRAFNMCDGARGQAEIAKALKIDPGNFSRTVSRWIDEIVFRLGEGRDAKLLHVYALSDGAAKTKGRGKWRRPTKMNSRTSSGNSRP